MSRLANLFGKHSTDERLLSGELSPDSDAGRARAEQLVSPHHRAECAKALMGLLEEAGRNHPSFFNANLRVQRTAIRENGALILALIRELEEPAVVDPRGVILADRLVQDGESPMYAYPAEDNGGIARAVKRAREALKAG